MAKKKKTNTSNRSYTDPVDSVYANLSGRSKKKRSKKRNPLVKVIVVLVIVLLVALGVLKALDYVSKLEISGPVSILPGRTLAEGLNIGGVDVGGMTGEEAVAALQKRLADDYQESTMTVTVLDRTLEITPSESEVRLDVQSMIDDAFRLNGHRNHEIELDVTSYLRLNKDALRKQVAEFAKFFPTKGTQTGWEIDHQFDGEEEQETLILTVGTQYYDFDQEDFYETLLQAYEDSVFQLVYPCQQLNQGTIDLDAIYEENCVEAEDAVLDPETHEVIRSIEGYRFDLEAAKEALELAMPGDVLSFPFEEIQPEMTTEELEAMLFRDVLGSYTAKAGSQSGRDTNLKLSCKAINGMILYPGDTFSYNQALGERTAEKGYKPAASYVGNETVQTYGGGICQTSSSLYYCTLIADLEIVFRSAHRFVSSYMPMGMDATVDWNGPDFKFRNNTDFPIRIEASASGGNVTVKLVGTDTKDYYVKMEYEVLSTTKPKTVKEEVEPGSGYKDGQVKTSAYTGYKVQTYKCKYDKETDELNSREKEAYSAYSKRDKVVYKVKVVEETTKPTEDTNPTQTTEPTETTRPTESAKPDDPTQATEPEDPTEETEPVPNQPIEEATG